MKMTKQEKLAKSYQKNYSSSHKHDVHDYDIPLQFILQYLSAFPKDCKILDAGCGNGRYAKKLNMLGFSSMYAVDIFENHLEDISFSQASIAHLPFQSDSFDFIYSLSVVHYLDDIEKGLIELNRVLKTKGFLMITNFSKNSIYALIRRMKRKLGIHSKFMYEYLQFQSPEYYKRLLTKHGFEIVLEHGFIFPQYTQLLNFLEFKGISTAIAPKPGISKNGILSTFKSKHGFHSVLVAKKH